MKKNYFLIVAVLAVAFMSSCKNDDATPVTPPTAYELANAQKGGMLYDAFWNKDAGSILDSATMVKLNASGNFFKCKSCHGPELNGSQGSYINRIAVAGAKGKPTVVGFSLLALGKGDAAQDIFDDIKNTAGRRSFTYDFALHTATGGSVGDQMPDYTGLLSDGQIWDLVKFIKEGAIDVTSLYTQTLIGTYPTGRDSISNIGLNGDAIKGKAYYTANCAICHGSDGKLEPGSTTFKGVGYYVRNEPTNIMNVVNAGRFSKTTNKLAMPAFKATPEEMKNLYKACADVVAFPL